MADTSTDKPVRLSLRLRNRKSLVDVSMDDSAFDSPGKEFENDLNLDSSIESNDAATETSSIPGIEPSKQDISSLFDDEIFSKQIGQVDVLKRAYRSKSIKDVLPCIALFVVVTSCIVLVSTFTFGFNREIMLNDDLKGLNGKYQSIAFANAKFQERLKREAGNPTEMREEGNAFEKGVAPEDPELAQSVEDEVEPSDPNDSIETLNPRPKRVKREDDDPFRRSPKGAKKDSRRKNLDGSIRDKREPFRKNPVKSQKNSRKDS